MVEGRVVIVGMEVGTDDKGSVARESTVIEEVVNVVALELSTILKY